MVWPFIRDVTVMHNNGTFVSAIYGDVLSLVVSEDSVVCFDADDQVPNFIPPVGPVFYRIITTLMNASIC